MKRVLVLLMLMFCAFLSFSMAAADQAAPSVNGSLHVEGIHLTDEHGQTVQLNGISTHGLSWFSQYVNQKTFIQLRDGLGVNAIRLAMYTAENAGYCSGGDQSKLKKIVRNGVKYAKEADLYVIIDWHILSDSNPNMHADEAIAFFDEMSKTLSGESHVLYEICNEPNGSTTWQDIKDYANRVIPAIRANDPDAVILVGTPNWSQSILDVTADPLPYVNVMYSLHFYAASHGQWLRDNMTAALEQGIPVFITEYGTCSADGNGVNDFESADAWVELIDRYQISNMMWNISNLKELSAIFQSGFKKSTGFTSDDLKDGAKWLANRLGGALAAEINTGAAATASMNTDLCEAYGSFGSWVDSGSGASAVVSWKGSSCSVNVSSSGSSRWFVQPSCSGLTLEKGASYRLTFTLSCTENISFDVCVQRNYGDYGAYAILSDLTASDSPQTHELEFVMNQATDTNVSLVFNVGGNGNLPYSVSITDVQLQKIS